MSWDPPSRPLGLPLRVHTAASLQRTLYDAAIPAYGPRRRKDSLRTWRIGLSARGWSFLGLAPGIDLVHERRRSTSELHRYGRIRAGLRLRHDF